MCEIDSLVKAMAEAFDNVYQEYAQKGYNVVPPTQLKRLANLPADTRRLNNVGAV